MQIIRVTPVKQNCFVHTVRSDKVYYTFEEHIFDDMKLRSSKKVSHSFAGAMRDHRIIVKGIKNA